MEPDQVRLHVEQATSIDHPSRIEPLLGWKLVPDPPIGLFYFLRFFFNFKFGQLLYVFHIKYYKSDSYNSLHFYNYMEI